MEQNLIPNKERGEFLVKVGDHEFVFEPSFGRIAKLEAALGKSLFKMSADLTVEKNLSFSDVATIIQVMSRDNKLSYEEIGALLVEKGLYSTAQVLTEFLLPILSGSGGNGAAKATP